MTKSNFLVETAALCCLLLSFQADTSGCQGQQQIRSEQEGSFGCRMFCRCGENPMPVASIFPIIFPTLDSAMNRSGKPGFLREYLLLEREGNCVVLVGLVQDWVLTWPHIETHGLPFGVWCPIHFGPLSTLRLAGAGVWRLIQIPTQTVWVKTLVPWWTLNIAVQWMSYQNRDDTSPSIWICCKISKQWHTDQRHIEVTAWNSTLCHGQKLDMIDWLTGMLTSPSYPIHPLFLHIFDFRTVEKKWAKVPAMTLGCHSSYLWIEEVKTKQ